MPVTALDTIQLLALMCFRDPKRRQEVMPALLESARLGLEPSVVNAASDAAPVHGKAASYARLQIKQELADVEAEFQSAGGRRGVLQGPPIRDIIARVLDESSLPGISAGHVLLNILRIEDYRKGRGSLNKAVALLELEVKRGVIPTVNQRNTVYGDGRTIKNYWTSHKDVAPLWAAALNMYHTAQLGSLHRPSPIFIECLMVYLTSGPLNTTLLRQARWFADWGETFRAVQAKQTLLTHDPSAPWIGERPQRPILWPLSRAETQAVDGYRSQPPKPRAAKAKRHRSR